MRDAEIVKLFMKRDERAIAELEGQYGRRLFRAAERLLSREDAEECVNDTWLQVWNHIPPDEPDHLGAYAEKILKNLALNRLRAQNAMKRKATLIELSDSLSECLPDPYKDTENEAIANVTDVLNEFLRKESRARRNMFLLRFLYGKSVEEVAETMGLPYERVKKTLWRMKERLKESMKS
ncbi:MAG: sigma-70 family RNA polymerase sigma factor [Lachnospiraceae bacterium]|nr:sigma-70 family RNA polymerase sigma factor [Lachnospiraceae bacterium]